jgi:hypothetical protein
MLFDFDLEARNDVTHRGVLTPEVLGSHGEPPESWAFRVNCGGGLEISDLMNALNIGHKE